MCTRIPGVTQFLPYLHDKIPVIGSIISFSLESRQCRQSGSSARRGHLIHLLGPASAAGPCECSWAIVSFIIETARTSETQLCRNCPTSADARVSAAETRSHQPTPERLTILNNGIRSRSNTVFLQLSTAYHYHASRLTSVGRTKFGKSTPV